MRLRISAPGSGWSVDHPNLGKSTSVVAGPAENLIGGKRLLIVPSGPLTSLPFNVLVTDPPKVAIPGKLADYRDAAWLGARTAITVLPSVASLTPVCQD